MTTLFPQPYLINRSHSEPPPLPPAIEEDLNTFPSLPQTHSAYPTLRPLSIPFPEAVPSSLSAREALGHQSTITGKAPSPVRSGTPGPPPVAKQWLHRSSNPHFLPPATSTPPALALLDDSLDLFREYRECVENVVKVQADYGRNLGSAIKKLENKLAQLHTGVPGEKKVPPSTLQTALSGHLQHLSTVANLHVKHAGAMASQLVEPLNLIEKRETEVLKRMGTWSKEVCSRWDSGAGAIEKAKDKYHSAHAAHQSALQKLRALPPPSSPHLPPPVIGNGPQPPPYPPTKAQAEYAKAQKAVEDLERAVRERKNAYIIALDGEGRPGGGGQSRREGGGLSGGGEESRTLHEHLQASLLETLVHHATLDINHYSLSASIIQRAKEGYEQVSFSKDQDDFLEAFQVGPWPSSDGYETDENQISAGGDGQAATGDERFIRHRRQSTLHRLRSSIGHQDGPPSTASLSRSQSISTLSSVKPAILQAQQPFYAGYQAFVAPGDAPTVLPFLERDRYSDTNWLRNRWVKSRSQLEDIIGVAPENGLLQIKRKELATLKNLCALYMENRGLGDPDEMWERRVGLLRELGVLERKAAVARAEMECVESALGSDIAPETVHDFKERLFPTPAICDVCKQKVWSAFVPEKSCRLCSIAVHTKCELNAFVECQGPSGRRRLTRASGSKGHVRRSLTARSLLRRGSAYYEPHGPAQIFVEDEISSSLPEEPLLESESHISPYIGVVGADRLAVIDVLNGNEYTTPPDPKPDPFEHGESHSDDDASPNDLVTASSFGDQSGVDSREGSRDRGTRICGVPLNIGRILYDFAAEAEYELSVTKGMLVLILEPDLEGCGWVKVRDGVKEGMSEGLVPAAYVVDSIASPPPGDGGSGSFVIALFDYSNPALEEHAAIVQHRIYELSVVGDSYDEYWSEVMYGDSEGPRLRGIVPTTYITPCN